MKEASLAYPVEYREAIGVLLSYMNGKESYQHLIDPTELFSINGFPNLMKGVDAAIKQATASGCTAEEVIKKSFFEKDGDAYRLMRITNNDFGVIEDTLYASLSLSDEDPTLRDFIMMLDSLGDSVTPGMCPSGFPMNVIDEQGRKTKRPIAGEYALVIARKFDELQTRNAF